MSFQYRIEQLDSRHDRSFFVSGSPPLDRYIREQATQNVRRLVAKCFVAAASGNPRVAGFYTLAASSIPIETLPDEMKRKMPRYPSVPVARVGRLAVDKEHGGKKLGAALLADALIRAAQADIGVFALVVDAKDEQAETFYVHFGFSIYGQRQLLFPLARVRSNAKHAT